MKIVKIQWTEPRPPDAAYHYDHVLGRCAFGNYSIEWNGWKEYDPKFVYFNGDYLESAHSVEDAKELAQKHFESIVGSCLMPSPTDHITDEEILKVAGVPETTPCWPWWLKEGVEAGEVRDAAVRFARAILAKFGNRIEG